MPSRQDPILALDVDGVLLDFLGGFVPWLRSLGYAPRMEAHEIDDWDFGTVLPEVSPTELMGLINDFAISPGFAWLDAFHGARDALTSLRLDFPSVEIIAVTSSGTSAVTETMRRANLDLHDFDIGSVTMLPLGASKRDSLLALPPGSIFVDDLMKNVRVAEECGLTSILFRRPYNAHESHSLCVNDWPDALTLLRDLLTERLRPSPSAA